MSQSKWWNIAGSLLIGLFVAYLDRTNLSVSIRAVSEDMGFAGDQFAVTSSWALTIFLIGLDFGPCLPVVLLFPGGLRTPDLVRSRTVPHRLDLDRPFRGLDDDDGLGLGNGFGRSLDPDRLIGNLEGGIGDGRLAGLRRGFRVSDDRLTGVKIGDDRHDFKGGDPDNKRG